MRTLETAQNVPGCWRSQGPGSLECQPDLAEPRSIGERARGLCDPSGRGVRSTSVPRRRGKMAFESVRLLFLLSFAVGTEVLADIIMRPSCATGWFYYKPNCYGYFRKLRSWSDAELECQSFGNGAHLASVSSAKEARVIAGYIRGYQRTKPVWIGLHDPQKKQQWEWIDGTTYLYRTWSGASVAGDQQCAGISAKNDFLSWNSGRCNRRQHFLCKYRP
ncbi:regenerating islet-derived protein 4 isoform X2 [Pteropus alecto]|uniref:regenerating islet-derived protein 4 isoform X2 n=1 Tax=Pteropus alecto TaxID=9402 RepID=UPI000D537424|nr:regenerating islet-derived protein 4 isoform X2 [Pteropus alecto]